ncbi:HU family DNA-binding protein [Loktanella sp. DJP18]|uniref:HU family DNA-binding protein n=1 Tax=Loktanella sp. DJP18 TaxID=3409788 RepID=UPI003BB520D0
MTAKPETPADGTVRLKVATPKVQVTAPGGASKTPAPRVVGAAVDVPAGEAMKKAEFIDRVIARANLKKKDAKPAIEAALAELADILAAGKELILPPMGKIKTVKVKDLGMGAQMLTLKLRTQKDGAGQGDGAGRNAKSGVAVADDDS